MAFVSPWLGEVRWADAKGQVDDDDDEIEVVVLDRRGSIAHFPIDLTKRWAGKGGPGISPAHSAGRQGCHTPLVQIVVI